MICGPFAPVMRGFVSVNFNLTKIKNMGANEPMYSSLDLSVKGKFLDTHYDLRSFAIHISCLYCLYGESNRFVGFVSQIMPF